MHVFRRQVTVPRQGTRSSCRAYLTIVRRGNGNGSVTEATRYFLWWIPVIVSSRRRHFAVRRCATALRSPCDCPLQATQNVWGIPSGGRWLMSAHSFPLLVSYNPRSFHACVLTLERPVAVLICHLCALISSFNSISYILVWTVSICVARQASQRFC